jgi:hypothetical protein
MGVIIASSSSNNKKSHPGYVSGRYYSGLQLVGDYTNSTTGLAINSVMYIPFYIDNNISINRLAVFCGGVVAGGAGRFGIYSNNNGLPLNLLIDGGDLIITSAGAKEAVVSLSLSPDWYWFSGISSTPPNLSCANFFLGNNNLLGQTTPGIQGSNTTCSLRHTAGTPFTSLPASAPTSNLSLLTGNIAPLFWYKIA